MSDQRIGTYGIVIFDGSCGACSTFVGRQKSFFQKHGFTVAPLQEPWVRELTGVDESALSQAICLWTNEGEILRGIDSLHALAEKIWWLAPLNLLLRVGFLKSAFSKLYDLIAGRRRQISILCGLQSRALYK